MKALILAAGLATRLQPYSLEVPKPLFTLMSRPVLDHVIQQLVRAGCTQILINTHHLHRQIEDFIVLQNHGIPIVLLHEQEILDTGGAIANAKSYLDQVPFFVINADVFSTIDLEAVYGAHLESGSLATLVLHDDRRFNTVTVDENNWISDFYAPGTGLTFTGVQVLSPEIFDSFPGERKFSSIALFQTLCHQKQIKACVQPDIFWSDIGTPEQYRITSLQLLCASILSAEYTVFVQQMTMVLLAGDGSDRKWYRIQYADRTLIVSDHDICLPGSDNRKQLTAFVNIGTHLASKNIPVPAVLGWDTLSGMVCLEDLNDLHLEQFIRKNASPACVETMYQRVIDHLIDFSIQGAQDFNCDWACQTPTYSKNLILEKECQYFIEAFVQDYLGLNVCFDDFLDEFDRLADQALKNAVNGLMHRDMQSRNIMIRDEQIFFIDFQSARIGPLQYDLASLLIDPYVLLDAPLQTALLQYAATKLNLNVQKECTFKTGFDYCCLTRNLQILGAFAFLTRQKHKTGFEQHIPAAVASLCQNIHKVDTSVLPKLCQLIQTIKGAVLDGNN